MGSNESFNELLVNNISLIRKRMVTENLKIESHILGKKSRTRAALLYIEGTAPGDLVKLAREKLSGMDNEFVLGIEYVSEALMSDKNVV